MPVDDDKYKALYEYHKDQFDYECERFNRLEDKSTKYLSAITIAVSAYVLLVRWSAEKIFPPTDCISWITVISIAVTFLALTLAWSFIFRSIKLQDLMKMPMGDGITEYFHDNSKSTVYLGLAKKYSSAAKAKEEQYNNKLVNVRKGYSEIVFSGWCFLISVILIFTKVWLGE